MKILIIQHSDELYGADRSILGLIKYTLESTKFTIEVWLPFEEGKLTKELEKLKISYDSRFFYRHVNVVKVSRKSIKNPLILSNSLISALYFLFKNRRHVRSFDIVHTNTVSVFLGSLVKLFFNVKHLWNVREIIDEPKFLSNIFRVYVNLFSDKVISNSKATKNWICKDKRKNMHIDNGVEKLNLCLSYNDQSYESFVKKKFDYLFGIVGRISQWKGQKESLSVISALKNKGINCGLVIVGDYHNENLLYKYEIDDYVEELGIGNNVFFSGYTDKLSYYLNPVFAQFVPSIKPEPFGRVAIEGFSIRKLIITSGLGGLRDIVINEFNGFVVDFEKPAVAANQIFEILKREDLEVVKDNAFSSYNEHYTTENCFKKYIREYRCLTER